MSLEAVLGFASNAAAMRHESETPMRGHTATCCREAELAGLAAAVLDWLKAELAVEGMLGAVDKVVESHHPDNGWECCAPGCEGIDWWEPRHVTTAALEAVTERLAGGER